MDKELIKQAYLEGYKAGLEKGGRHSVVFFEARCQSGVKTHSFTGGYPTWCKSGTCS